MSSILLASAILLAYVLSLMLFFKANAGVMFLAACTGIVLLSTIDPTVITIAGTIVPSDGEAYVRLSVVLLSVLFAAMMFRKSVQGPQIALHAGIGGLLSVALVLILPETTGVSWLLDATKQSLWQDVDKFRSLIVASGFALSLVAVLTTKKPHKKSKH
jgi:hypothetical protein